MNQFVEITSQKPGSMNVRLKDPSLLDLGFFSGSPRTDWTLSCLVREAQKGELLYSTEQLIPLSDFLEETEFTRKEAYQFLSSLLEKLIFTARSHILLLDLEGIYVSALGDEFWFAPLPVNPSCQRMFQKQKADFLERLCQAVKMPGIYEILGYLVSSLKEDSLSLPEVLCGLQDLESQFVHRSFLERLRPHKGYRRKEPASARFKEPETARNQAIREDQFEVMEKRSHQTTRDPFVFRQTETSGSLEPFFAEPETKSSQMSCSSFPHDTGKPGAPEEKQAVFLKTEVIAQESTGSGSLELNGKRYELRFETTEIGRHVSCSIQLDDPSVSLHHARITCDQGRCYITSLGSTNGTFLNEKKVIRRMRLREGMVLRFGNTQAVFHE